MNERERTVASVATSIRHQTSGCFAARCSCGLLFDAGKALQADSQGVCATCALKREIA